MSCAARDNTAQQLSSDDAIHKTEDTSKADGQTYRDKKTYISDSETAAGEDTSPGGSDTEEEEYETDKDGQDTTAKEEGERLTFLKPYSKIWLFRYANASVLPRDKQVGDNGVYDDITDYPPSDTYKLIVRLQQPGRCGYCQRTKTGSWTVLEQVMICSTGGNGNWTPEGQLHHRQPAKSVSAS